ncbi:MAG: S1C family serine protease [Candidatus Nanoarchaeia archaeon]
MERWSHRINLILLVVVVLFLILTSVRNDSRLDKMEAKLNDLESAMKSNNDSILEDTVRLNADITSARSEIVSAKEDSAVESALLQSKMSAINSEMNEIRGELGLQAKILEETANEEETFKENIRKAKKATVRVRLLIEEYDGIDEGGSGTGKFEALCSAVMYRVEGSKVYAVTNEHCVDWSFSYHGLTPEEKWKEFDPSEEGLPEIRKVEIKVVVDGNEKPAELEWTGPSTTDLAVISFEAPADLELAVLSSVLPETGTPVAAIGHPQGLEYSVSQGIVSATREYNFGLMEVVQTDAAINGGNSGGGLFDLKTGRMLGINSFVQTDSEGLAFAISTKSFLAYDTP